MILVVKIVPGIVADSTETILLAALLLGFLNAVLRPLILFLTLPLLVYSLGFFTLIVNGLMLYGVSKIVNGFYVHGFGSAFWGALFFSMISFFLSLFIDPQGTTGFRVTRTTSSSAARRFRNDHIIDVEGKTTDDDKNRIK